MQASERKISQVLTEEIRYEVPPYQRPYSWTRENVEQLLDDVWEAHVRNDTEYFIGSLITIERERDRLYDVVDGQQRLTTLNLILARLRDHVSEPARTALGKRVLPANELTGEQGAPRLTLRRKDQKFFRLHVLDGKPVEPAHEAEIQAASDAPKLRIIENLAAIDAFCAERDEAALKAFANYLLTQVYVVFVTTGSLSSAYRLFNVLNARGLALSNADLIKNALFSELSDQTLSAELEEAWLELEDTVGVDRLDGFLGHYRTSLTAAKARGSLHEEFAEIISGFKGRPFDFLRHTNDSARNYMRILNGEFDSVSAKRALRSLGRVKFEEWIPPLLAFLDRPAAGMAEADYLSLLEKITFQNWVRRLAFTARQTVYFQIIKALQVENRPVVADLIRSIVRDASNNEEFLQFIDGEIYTRPFAQAVLLRIEEADQDESVTKSYDGHVTIEHVLPQSLADPYWQSRFDLEAHRGWIHRLANLALLAGTKNYRAKNYDFDRKKVIYTEKNNSVSFDTTKLILAEGEWNEEALDRRQRELRSRAAHLWLIGD